LNNLGSAAADFRFEAIEDWGCGSNAKNTESNIAGKNPKLVLQLGDYSYQSNATCWFNIIKPIDSKSKINIGNHDDESKSLLNSYLNHFHLKKPYYTFNFENVHFLILNTEDTKLKKTSSASNAFAENDLKSASKDANIGWIIVSCISYCLRLRMVAVQAPARVAYHLPKHYNLYLINIMLISF
jgi:hypothetical protein